MHCGIVDLGLACSIGWHTQELESNLAESAGAMAAMQRALEERAQQASVAADHAHSQAAEAASLRAQLAQLGCAHAACMQLCRQPTLRCGCRGSLVDEVNAAQ